MPAPPRRFPMKPTLFLLLALLACASCSRGGYTGQVSGVKYLPRGGAVIDLDGRYPNQKITLYVSVADFGSVGPIPPVGAEVTATGPVTEYRGRQEIRIHSKNQWRW